MKILKKNFNFDFLNLPIYNINFRGDISKIMQFILHIFRMTTNYKFMFDYEVMEFIIVRIILG